MEAVVAKIMHDENQCEVVCVLPEEWECIRDIIEKARTFSIVRKMEGYDDNAHKSAGWYLSIAVEKLNP